MKRRGRRSAGRDRERADDAGTKAAVAATVVSDATPPPSPGPEPAAGGSGRRRKLTVHLDEGLVDRVKNAAYWNPRLTIARIAAEGIRLAVERVEREHGGPYPRREADLVGGRPIK